MPTAPIVAAVVKAGGHRQVFYGWWIVAAFAVTQQVQATPVEVGSPPRAQRQG
jgi:hypothetical protein